MTLSSRVSRSFQRWIDAQDVEAYLQASSPKPWFGITIVWIVMIGGTACVPGVRETFQMRAAPEALCFLLPFSMAMLLALLRGKRKDVRRWEWLFLVGGSAAVEFCAASMVTFSSMPGAAVFATTFLLTLGLHGYTQKVTLTEPFVAIGTLVAAVAALALNFDADHRALFSILIPAGLAFELFAGMFATTQARARAETDRLRAAVAAEILERQSTEVNRLSESLGEVLGYNHDINNAMTSIGLGADALGLLLVNNEPPLDVLREVAAINKENVERVRALLLAVRDARPKVAEAEKIDAFPIIESVRKEVSGRFGRVRIALGEEMQPGLSVRVRGGPVSLHRVLLNLVTNACEGNGTASATEIAIRAALSSQTRTVALTVEDNGPGFDEQALKNPIEGLTTSKKSGTGLGLYTSERLVRASGGVIERANRPSGGAIVRVVLPLDVLALDEAVPA